MIIGLWHRGSGLGDQLFCYLSARFTAERLGVDFGIVGDFKGSSFMNLDRGIVVPFPFIMEEPAGKVVVQNDWPIFEGLKWYNPEFNFVEDNTIVDGCMMQDWKYFGDRLSDVRDWLKVEPLQMPDNKCIIGFRGGEFTAIPELFLTKDYWVTAMNKIREIEPGIEFEIVSDDPETARSCFPHIPVTHEISLDWRKIRYAKYLIVSNSCFYILPSLLNQDVKMVIAPRYWARRNTKEWSTVQNYYKQFTHL